ncbi:MAG: serine/threonine protein kinase [Acidobacteria bacterium]|nr:serine/threonine protein kinase [Acidobacteriota bacterium]
MAPSAPEATAAPPRHSAIDIADALLCVLVFERASALMLAPGGDRYEVVLTRESAPEPLADLPPTLGHAVAARLGLMGGLDPWGTGDRLGRVTVRVGRARGEFVVILRDLETGFEAELRRLVEYGDAATTGELASGTGRIGPYLIEREIGRGAMGIVYRATREGASTPVAVKLLNPTIAADPAMSARFVREGRAAALVNDTGVVGVTDFGTLPDGQSFLVMELVEGRTLEEVLEKSGPLLPEEAVRIVRRIAAALAAAHVRGVIHRDLKPSNVFVTAEDQIKIVDFGAALVQDALRGATAEASVILGTPAYMAPEQAQARPTDDRADVYSLGCILFRMLSGAPPFQGGAVLEVLQKHIHDAPPQVTSPRGPLPERLVECVARALAKLPEERFRGVSEMKETLDLVQRELGGSDRIPRP